MVYNIKEYNSVFNTPAKRQQELAVANKIMELLNKNKYNNLDEFIKRNSTYQDFIKNNNMNNVLKHFGNTLNEEDYKKIFNNLQNLTNTKQSFEKENIKITNIDDKEYNSFKSSDKSFFIDNSDSKLTIEEQIKDVQMNNESAQTSNIEKNTENAFKELSERKKENLNLQNLNEISFSTLTNEQTNLVRAALNYQLGSDKKLRIDLDRAIIVDEENNIIKIEKKDGEYHVVMDQDSSEKDNIISEQIEQPSKQFILTPNKDTIYSNNN